MARVTKKAKKDHAPDQSTLDIAKMLLAGLSQDMAKLVLTSTGIAPRHARDTVVRARKYLDKTLAQARPPERAELIELHRMMLSDAMAAGKLDVAVRVLRSLTDLATADPDMRGVRYDDDDPRAYVRELLRVQAAGQRIPPATVAAAARAVNAITAGQTEETEAEEAQPEGPPESVAEAAARALRIIDGGR